MLNSELDGPSPIRIRTSSAALPDLVLSEWGGSADARSRRQAPCVRTSTNQAHRGRGTPAPTPFNVPSTLCRKMKNNRTYVFTPFTPGWDNDFPCRPGGVSQFCRGIAMARVLAVEL